MSSPVIDELLVRVRDLYASVPRDTTVARITDASATGRAVLAGSAWHGRDALSVYSKAECRDTFAPIGSGGGGSDAISAENFTIESGGPLQPPSTTGEGGLAAGYGATAAASGTATGSRAEAALGSVAHGAAAMALGEYSTAIGPSSSATGTGAVALGYFTRAGGTYSFAMAPASNVPGDASVGAGPFVYVPHLNCFVFGAEVDSQGVPTGEGAYSTDPNQVVLGTEAHNVIVRGQVVLKSPNGSFFAVHVDDTGALSTATVTLSPKPTPPQ